MYLLNVMSCHVGFLNIHSQKSNMMYCGIHPFMVCFPPERNVNIDLATKSFVTYKVDFNFIVLDPNRIRSKYIQSKNIFHLKWSVYFSANKYIHEILTYCNC